MSAMTMFFNPKVQGMREDIEFLRRNPSRVGLRRAAMLSMSVAYDTAMIDFLVSHGFMGEDWKDAINRIPWYDRANFINIPYALDPNGKVAYLRFPVDETTRMFKNVAFHMFKAMSFEDVVKTIFRSVDTEMPTFNPIIGSISDTFQYLSGGQLWDSFYGTTVIPDNMSKMSIFEGPKAWAFAKHMWNNIGGGSVIYKPSTSELRDMTPDSANKWVVRKTDELLRIPGLQMLALPFVKVSDQGLSDAKNKETAESQRVDQTVSYYVKQMGEALGKNNDADFREALGKLNLDRQLTIDEALALARHIPSLNYHAINGRIGMEGDPWVRMLMKARTKAELIGTIETMKKMSGGRQ
jgi:hypothetical protein